MAAKRSATPEVDLSEFDVYGTPGRRLVLDDLIPQLPDVRREQLLAALRLPARYSHYRVAAVLRTWGHNVHEGSVRNWRARHLT